MIIVLWVTSGGVTFAIPCKNPLSQIFQTLNYPYTKLEYTFVVFCQPATIAADLTSAEECRPTISRVHLCKDPVIVVQIALVCWKVGGNIGVISITLAQPM